MALKFAGGIIAEYQRLELPPRTPSPESIPALRASPSVPTLRARAPEKKEAKSERPSSKKDVHVDEEAKSERPSAKKGSGRSKGSKSGKGETNPVKAVLSSDAEKPGQKVVSSSRVPELQRPNVCAHLKDTPFLENTDPFFMHGRLYDGPMQKPTCIWDCKKPPRDDHSAPKWLTASEFQDEEEVAHHKVCQLAALMRISKKTVLYTGAGISASVIGQAARSGQNKQGWKSDTRAAKPTPTHCALGLLGQQGLIHGWVQQNHDGLPQKAGFPQECINEIHGSWFDPSNPVVKYCGTLHERAWPWMVEDAETADLVIVLGTSLGGLEADEVATNVAERTIVSWEGALGTVCINLQQTEQDGIMTLRLFGKCDHLTSLLLKALGFISAGGRFKFRAAC